MTPEEYQKQLKERDDIIDNLFIGLQSVKNGKYAEIVSLLERTVRERNELDVQRAETQFKFDSLISQLEICRHVTAHFVTEKAPN